MNENFATAEQIQGLTRPKSATEAAVAFFKEYARQRPEVVALWCFGIGFILGWKLKPW